MPALKVIALISGGKDSLYSILHCLSLGHSVIALANLYPAPQLPAVSQQEEAKEKEEDGAANDDDDDDLNSYMYQTVGHSIIPLYASALALPLYRQPIRGSALNADKEYAPAPAPASASPPSGVAEAADETEDLYALLERILAAHPDATAVSTGAILSTYQRTRVESVAVRLGLVPLGWLWQYTALPPYGQAALLEDMAAVGQDARIVKVASGGLDASFLWENVASPRTVGRLRRVMGRFGGADGAVVGEGGEFETLAVDGPGVLWKKRIKVEVDGVVVGGGGSASVRLKGAVVVEKERGIRGEEEWERLRKPGLLDGEFEGVLGKLVDAELEGSAKGSSMEDDHSKSSDSTVAEEISSLSISGKPFPSWEIAQSGNTLSFLNMTAPDAGVDAAAQLSSIMVRLQSILKRHHLEPFNVIFSTLLLRSMADFAAINPIYGNLFTKPIPPSRVTVSCGAALPEGIQVALSVTVSKNEVRRGLHVQSRSYWAPANIGPYSQAVAIPVDSVPKDGQADAAWDNPQVVYVAGQIPLVPATMEMVKPNIEEGVQGGLEGFKIQTVLALQHLWRIGRVMNVGWWTGGVAFISHCSRDEGKRRARIAGKVWKAIHLKSRESSDSEDEGEEGDGDDVDVWHRKHGGFSGGDSVEKDERPLLPDYARVSGGEEATIPPCFTVQVKELPRAADIEWSSVGLAKSRVAVKQTTSIPAMHVTRVLDTSSSFVFVGIEDMKALLRLEKFIKEAHEWETISWTLQTYDHTPQPAFQDLIAAFPDGGTGSHPLEGENGEHFYITKMTRAEAREVMKHAIVKYMAENESEDESDGRGHIYSETDLERIQEFSAPVENQYVVYTSQALPTEWLEDVEIKKQVISCQRVWDANGNELAAAVVIRRNTEVLS